MQDRSPSFQHLRGIGKGSLDLILLAERPVRFLPAPSPPLLHPQVYTRYGKCYTFNGDRRNPRVTRQGGMGNGLEIMLDIQQEEYLPIWRETSEWGRGVGRAEARDAGREGCWASRAPQGRELWGKRGTGGVLVPRVQVLGSPLPFSRR